MIEIKNQNARVERCDEVGVVYEDADFRATADGLQVSREGEPLAWYAPNTWTAVIFGVVSSDG